MAVFDKKSFDVLSMFAIRLRLAAFSGAFVDLGLAIL